MIISDSHKFIFVHCWKTGGTSITQMILPIINRQCPIEIGLSGWQGTVHEGCQHNGPDQNPDIFKGREDYEMVVCVRNTWDWCVSMWASGMFRNAKSFDDAVDELYDGKWPSKLRTQSDFATLPDGYTNPIRILRFEHLAEDVRRWQDEAGFGGELPHVVQSKRGPCWRYYDRRKRDMIGEVYQEDVERFGFLPPHVD